MQIIVNSVDTKLKKKQIIDINNKGRNLKVAMSMMMAMIKFTVMIIPMMMMRV